MNQTAIITGVTGQDGSYLAELLLRKGYNVHGVVRPGRQGLGRCSHLADRIQFHHVELLASDQLQDLVTAVQPVEFYHLASISFVPQSWEDPEKSCEVTGLSALRALEAIRHACPGTKFYQAGSSEMFGRATTAPQNEATPFSPRNPYATAKLLAHQITVNYRERYGMFACNGILYNHESPRRGKEFVTRKITRSAAAIKLGQQTELRLGNLDCCRDWGFAGDYVQSMWQMLQQQTAQDYVVGTGVSTSVREFARLAFEEVGLDYRDFVVVAPEFYRPCEDVKLVADASKIKSDLGWTATTPLPQLIRMMVRADLQELKCQRTDSQSSAFAPKRVVLQTPSLTNQHSSRQTWHATSDS